MQTIKTNISALESRINAEVTRAIEDCQNAANTGHKHIYFVTDRDIYQQVRERLSKEYSVFVPTVVYRNAPTRTQIEHLYNGQTQFKLVW